VKIVVGSDHRGFALKEAIVRMLRALRHDVVDVGTTSVDSVDYTDFAIDAAERVGRGDADRGILVCGSGVGMSIAANKVDGVRAALAVDAEGAHLARAHNDANVLALGSWQEKDEARALAIVGEFLSTDFEGGRHTRRVEKIRDYERKGRRS
jgi:RpiB/LacA/LacB family sugar-phosphate isomerase